LPIIEKQDKSTQYHESDFKKESTEEFPSYQNPKYITEDFFWKTWAPSSLVEEVERMRLKEGFPKTGPESLALQSWGIFHEDRGSFEINHHFNRSLSHGFKTYSGSAQGCGCHFIKRKNLQEQDFTYYTEIIKK
jgi:hypothetical protein